MGFYLQRKIPVVLLASCVAAVVQKRILSVREEQIGPDHPEMPDLLEGLGRLRIDSGTMGEEAAEVLRESLEISGRALNIPGIKSGRNTSVNWDQPCTREVSESE